MIDNRKIAEITGVWRCDFCDEPFTDRGMGVCCLCEELSCRHPDFEHDAEAFVKVLDWLWSHGYVVNLRLGLAVIAKDDELVHSNVGDFKTALLLAVQQIGDSDAS